MLDHCGSELVGCSGGSISTGAKRESVRMACSRSLCDFFTMVFSFCSMARSRTMPAVSWARKGWDATAVFFLIITVFLRFSLFSSSLSLVGSFFTSDCGLGRGPRRSARSAMRDSEERRTISIASVWPILISMPPAKHSSSLNDIFGCVCCKFSNFSSSSRPISLTSGRFLPLPSWQRCSLSTDFSFWNRVSEMQPWITSIFDTLCRTSMRASSIRHDSFGQNVWSSVASIDSLRW
mmetsp:Transcript_7816/g.25495  ORF Transcript_7816/g.25495 Transcript_7816/m.25495 type:complete len:236 (-) Transcript_7816:500-1207(-)